jgi:TonB family protein
MKTALALSLLILAAPIGAQAPKADSSTCAAVFSRSGTQVDSLVISAEPNHQLEKVPASAARLLATSVATELALPKPIVFPPVATLEPESKSKRKGPAPASQSFSAEAVIMLDGNGDVASVAIRQTSLEPTLDSLLLAAVRSAVAFPLADELRAAARAARGGIVSIRFFSASPTHYEPPPRSAKPRPPEVVLGAVRVPVFSAGKEPLRLSGPFPHYPSDLQARGVDGEAVLRFVIGADGKAVPQTVTLVRGDAEQFTAASVVSVLQTTFAPGTVEGCPVAMLVQQPFTFRIGR